MTITDRIMFNSKEAYMKTILSILFFFFMLCVIPLRSVCLEVDFIFDTGFRAGTTKEFVYEGEKRISRLDWSDRIVPVVGFTGQIEAYNFILSLGITSAVPVLSGEMEDYDYLIPNSAEPSLYSWHDLYLDKDFSCRIEGGYKFQLKDWRLTPSAGFKYINRKWTASDGFLQYPITGTWTGNEPKKNLNGQVISYEQAVWFPYLTLELGYNHTFNNESKIQIAVHGAIYPYICAETNDIHFLRDKQFYDSLRGGLGWKYGVIIRFYPKNVNGLGFILHSGYETINNVKGVTSANDTGINDGSLIITEGYSGETEIKQFFVELSIVIPLFRRSRS